MSNYAQDAVNAVAMIVVILFAAHRVRVLIRNPRDPSTQVFTLVLASLAVVLGVGNVEVYRAIDRLTGIPHVAQLVMQGMGLVAAWSIQVWVLHWTYPADEARRKSGLRAGVLLLAIALLALFFFLAPIDREVPRFLSVYATAPWMGPYYLVFLGYFGFSQADLCRMSLRYSFLVDNRILRFGLRTVALGAVFGVLYVLNTGSFTLGTLAGFTPGWPHEVPNRIAQTGAMYLILTGATFSAWAPRIAAWSGRYQQYRRLFPLWRALRAAFPAIALDPQPSPAALLVRSSAFRTSRLRYRIMRLVTEINDGRLQLRPHMDPDLNSTPRTAETEADRIAAALRANAAGQSFPQNGVAEAPGGADLDAEIAWLADVADSFSRSGSR